MSSAVGIVVLLGLIIAPPLLLLTTHRADLVVLCSNAEAACTALADRYERDSGHDVDVIRIPTSEALGRLLATGGDAEFDVWLGGPAEAHAQAERLGLLRNAPDIDASALPSRFHSTQWFGVYGGVLSLCVSEQASDADSWAQLLSSPIPLILPSPLTSGTAATMLNLHAERLGGVDAAMSYLRNLDEQTVAYVDSGTDPAHLVAIGRVPAGVAFDNYCRLEAAQGHRVSVVYPRDGTGFEIGAASLPTRDKPSPLAESFLAWVVSDEGQALSASVTDQAPVSTRLSGNISERLDALDTVVYGHDPAASSLRRSQLITNWTAQVYLPVGAPTPSDSSGSADETPTIGWIDLAPTVMRTAGMGLLAALLATVLGCFIAVVARLGSPWTRLLVPLALMPALVPAGVIAHALIAVGAPAYSPITLVAALALSAAPFAALVEWFSLSSMSDSELMAASDLGAGQGAIIRRLIIPRLRSGAIPSLAVATLMAASDTSATSALGGSEPFLAPFARAALDSGLGSQIPLSIAAVYAGAAFLTTLVVIRALTFMRFTPRRAPGEGVRALSGHLPAFSRASLLPVVGLAALNGVLTGFILTGAVRSVIEGESLRASPAALRESALILLIVIPASTLLGFLAAHTRWRRPVIVNSVFLTALLASPVAGGILIRALHRNPIAIADRTVLPPLVGAGSPGSGIIAVVLANLILSVPVAYFLMSFALAGTRTAASAARDAGASPLRSILEVLIPASRARLIAAIAALSALIMCMSAPSVFVAPVGSSFPAVALIPVGIHGDTDEVFLFGALSGICALAMITIAVFAITSASRRRHDR